MPVRLRVSILYRPDWEDPNFLRAFFRSLAIAGGLAALVFFELSGRVGVPLALLVGVAAFVVFVVLVTGAVLWITSGVAGALTSFLFPSGRTTPAPRDFSREKALVAKGRVDEALALLEPRLLATPDDAEVCVFAADLYAREAARPGEAEALFRRARLAPRVSAAHDLYATQRLIDLYLGPLDDEPRAAGELRRLMEKHPATRAAEHAAHALRGLSAVPGAASRPL